MGHWNNLARAALSRVIEDEKEREELVEVLGLRLFLEHSYQTKECKPIDTRDMPVAVREGFRRARALPSPFPIPEIVGLDESKTVSPKTV